MEYLSTSISGILAARRSTPSPRGWGRKLSNEMVAGLAAEFEYPMHWKYESECARMGSRKIPFLDRGRLTFLAHHFYSFLSVSGVMIGETNRDGSRDRG